MTSDQQQGKALVQPTGQAQERVQSKLRLFSDTRTQVDYWRRRRGYESANEYMEAAVEEKIARENGDYDLPTLEQQRLAQLIDEIRSLSENVANLENVNRTSFESILSLARGENYLLDPDDGELRGEVGEE